MSAARSRVLTFSCIFSPRHHIVDSELNPKNRRPGPGLTFGAAHFYRTFPRDSLSSLGEDIGIARTLEIDFPGRTFLVIPVGRLDRPRGVTRGIDPDFQKFDPALKTPVRPVLVSLQRLPFRDFIAEEFLGGTLTIGAGGGFFREAVSLSARWLMRAFMLAGAPTSIRKRSQLDSGHAGAVFVRSKLQLMGSGSEFCDSFAAEVETLLLIPPDRAW
jgi:hypothetical protein